MERAAPRIKNLGAWRHHLDSTGLVDTTLSTTKIRDQLADQIGTDDELLVVDVTGDARRAWRGFNESGSKWLTETWE